MINYINSWQTRPHPPLRPDPAPPLRTETGPSAAVAAAAAVTAGLTFKGSLGPVRQMLLCVQGSDDGIAHLSSGQGSSTWSGQISSQLTGT